MNSCSRKLITNFNGDDSPIGIINKEIKAGNVNQNTPIYLENELITLEDLQQINTFKSSDFTSIRVLSKEQATEKIDPKINRKIIQLIPFKDEQFDVEFYQGITNDFILDIIKRSKESGQIRLYPILVLNGKPLQGNDIRNKINSINKKQIQEIIVLKKQAAYSVYGIRALNGVLVITTK